MAGLLANVGRGLSSAGLVPEARESLRIGGRVVVAFSGVGVGAVDLEG